MTIHATDMVADVIAQIDAVTLRNYPGANKYACRAGALEALLWSTLGHLNQNQREFWVEQQKAVFAFQMTQEIQQ